MMATVRMNMMGVGLLACGIAFADGVAPVEVNPPAQSAVEKTKPVQSGKKSAKSALAQSKPSKNAAETKKSSTRAGSGRMQVVEPKSAVPMGTAKESRNWQKNHVRGLTEDQKQAFRERKEKMEGLITVIKEKRKALRDAKPEERAVLARELHSLILEKDPDAANSGASAAASTARVGSDANVSDHSTRPTTQADAAKTQADAEKKSEAAEARRKRIESYQSEQKKEDMRRQRIEKQRSDVENGVKNGNTVSAQATDED